MDTESFTASIETKDIYKEIAEDVETRFGASNYEFDKPLAKEKNEKDYQLSKSELDR